MSSDRQPRVPTGVAGLDEVLHGGLLPGRGYMVTGPAGVGKTILGLHFLADGVANGETTLFINLEEDIADLRDNAAALGFDTDDIDFLDLSPDATVFTDDRSYEVFTAADVEGESVTDRITERVRAVDPDRVVVDPLTQLWYLTRDEYQFRKQVVGFLRFITQRDATLLFTVQDTASLPTEDLEFISDGTLLLTRTETDRRVAVPKFRGSPARSGDHVVRITDTGMRVYPALVPDDHHRSFDTGTLSAGVPGIDDLLHGGLARGTVTVVSGPTGVGKTTLGTQFVKEAAGRGERSVVYLFEENERTFIERSTAVNIPVPQMVERGTLELVEVEALEFTPQEFAAMVRSDVEASDTAIVMVDGIAGYRLTVQNDRRQATQHLHALGRYLKNMGVTTLFIDETADVTGTFHATEENISYLADAIVFLRHLEVAGELRKAIGVLKQRTSDFERLLREFEITRHGLRVGDPLTDMRGILTGTPERIVDQNPGT